MAPDSAVSMLGDGRRSTSPDEMPNPAEDAQMLTVAPETATGELPEVREDSGSPRRRWPDWAAPVVYLLGGCYLLGKLWLDPNQRLQADNIQDQGFFEFVLAHAARSVTHLSNPLFEGQINVPHGVNMIANTSILGLAIPLTPVTLLFGPGVAFAVLVVLATSLTATAWYYVLSRHVVQSRVAAFVGGAFCGFAPGFVSQSNGHPNVAGQFMVPLIFLQIAKLRGCRTGGAHPRVGPTGRAACRAPAGPDRPRHRRRPRRRPAGLPALVPVPRAAALPRGTGVVDQLLQRCRLLLQLSEPVAERRTIQRVRHALAPCRAELVLRLAAADPRRCHRGLAVAQPARPRGDRGGRVLRGDVARSGDQGVQPRHPHPRAVPAGQLAAGDRVGGTGPGRADGDPGARGARRHRAGAGHPGAAHRRVTEAAVVRGVRGRAPTAVSAAVAQHRRRADPGLRHGRHLAAVRDARALGRVRPAAQHRQSGGPALDRAAASGHADRRRVLPRAGRRQGKAGAVRRTLPADVPAAGHHGPDRNADDDHGGRPAAHDRGSPGLARRSRRARRGTPCRSAPGDRDRPPRRTGPAVHRRRLGLGRPRQGRRVSTYVAAVDTAETTESPEQPSSRGAVRALLTRYRFGLFATLCYVLGGFWVYARLWVDPAHRLVGDGQDHQLFIWMLAHAARSVTHLENPLFSARLNVPDGVNMMANTSVLGLGIPMRSEERR